MTRNEMIKELKKNTCKVKFLKRSDGQERVMRCTLKEDVIKQRFGDYESEELKKNDGHGPIVVLDIEKNDWRAFWSDSVLDFQVQ